jgi:hypothetical protein
MLDKEEKGKKLRDLRKFKANRLQRLNNDT